MKNNEIYNKIKELEEKYEKQQEVLEFLIKHGKDGVETSVECGFCWICRVIKYLYNGELKKVGLEQKLDINIVNTNETEIIFTCVGDYYKIDKATATYMQIPEPLFVRKEKEKETKAKNKNANT
jgi:hypothetical protein